MPPFPVPRDAPASRAVSVLVDGAVTSRDIPELWDRMRALMESAAADVIVCSWGGRAAPDAGTVDALARLQLTARRSGKRVVLLRPSIPLRELLTFLGLDDVLPACAPLLLEASGEPEEREEVGGVEERVDPGDATV